MRTGSQHYETMFDINSASSGFHFLGQRHKALNNSQLNHFHRNASSSLKSLTDNLPLSFYEEGPLLPYAHWRSN